MHIAKGNTTVVTSASLVLTNPLTSSSAQPHPFCSRDARDRENRGPTSWYSQRQMFPRAAGIPRSPPPFLIGVVCRNLEVGGGARHGIPAVLGGCGGCGYRIPVDPKGGNGIPVSYVPGRTALPVGIPRRRRPGLAATLHLNLFLDAVN